MQVQIFRWKKTAQNGAKVLEKKIESGYNKIQYLFRRSLWQKTELSGEAPVKRKKDLR